MVSFSTTDLCGNATNCVNYYRYKVNLGSMTYAARHHYHHRCHHYHHCCHHYHHHYHNYHYHRYCSTNMPATGCFFSFLKLSAALCCSVQVYCIIYIIYTIYCIMYIYIL